MYFSQVASFRHPIIACESFHRTSCIWSLFNFNVPLHNEHPRGKNTRASEKRSKFALKVLNILMKFNQSFSVGLQKVYFCLLNWVCLLANCTDNQFRLCEGSQSGYLCFIRILDLDDVFGLHEGLLDKIFLVDKNS